MKSHVLIIGLFFQFLSFSIFTQEFSTLGEIYDFDPEDKFQRIEYNCCNEVFFQLSEVNILERYNEQNSIRYIQSSSLFTFVFANPPTLVDTIHHNIIDTISILNPDSMIFNNGDEIISNSNIYNGRKICVKHSNLMGKPKTDKYVNGCGLAVTLWYIPNDSICRISDSLVYFKKGNEEWGVDNLLSTKKTRAFQNILVYPNPFKNTFNVNLHTQNRIHQIKIYDLFGKQIFSTLSDQNKKTQQLNLSHFKKGVYLLHINTVISFIFTE